MLSKSIHTARSQLLGFAQSGNGAAFAGGIVSGIYVLAWTHQYFAQLGTSLPTVTAAGSALAIGLAIGSRRPGRWFRGVDPLIALGSLHFLGAAWAVAFPWMIQIPFAVASHLSAEALSTPWSHGAFLTCTAGILLGVPMTWLGRLPDSTFRAWNELRIEKANAAERTGVLAWTYVGVIGGILATVSVSAPWIGIQISALLAALAGGGLFLGCMTLGAQRGRSKANVSAGPLGCESPVRPVRGLAIGAECWKGLVAVAAGCLVALMCRLIDQLMLAGNYLLYAQWSAVLAGAVTALFLSRRRRPHGNRHAWSASSCCLGLAAWSSFVIAAIGLLVRWSLIVNAGVSHVGMVMFLRGLTAAGVLFPVGLIAGIACWRPRVENETCPDEVKQPGATSEAVPVKSIAIAFPGWHIATFALGYFLTRWFVLSRLSAANSVMVVACSLGVMALLRWLCVHDWPRETRVRVVVAGMFLAVTGGTERARHFDPSVPSKLLFSTVVSLAHRGGVDYSRLLQLDEGRNLAVQEGDLGTYTLWRYRGSQLQLRENGIPKTVVSTNTRACPQYSAEVLPAVIPLVLHEAPRRVLVLGLKGGVPLSTCLEFPVESVACVEPDRRLIRMVQGRIAAERGADPLNDDRARLWEMEPALAVACRSEEFDVIVSMPDEAAVSQSTPYFCREFYERAAHRLSRDGIFTQRVHFLDYAPEALRVMAGTLQSVFREVLAIEVAPGAMLFVATNSEAGLVRPKLVARAQLPQVRRVLADTGWDWSIFLNLPAYSDGHLKKLRMAGRFGVNTAADDRLGFRLPQQVIAWEAKQQEVYSLLAPLGGRLLDWVGEDANSPEVLGRYAEVVTQRKLIDANPDEPYVYRKAVREQLTNRPLSQIQQVSATDPNEFSPEDKRRLRYFALLGAAAREKSPSPEAIRRVADLERPFDPLISYFLHHEVAALYARSDVRDPREESVHRLHSVYYSTPTDRSVRNVIGALKLLIEEPSAATGPADRWDQINALIQMLEIRWQNRGAVNAMTSRFILNDIEKSVSVLEESLDTMRRLAPEVGVPAEAVEARQQVVEANLVRPLRTYRARLLPRQYRELSRTRASLEHARSESENQAVPPTAER